MKKTFIPVALFVISLLLLAGCGTSSSVVMLGEAPSGYTTLTHEGITLELSYLDQRDLYKLYGQNNNPFVNYKTGRLIVIEILMQSDAPLRVHLDEQCFARTAHRYVSNADNMSGYPSSHSRHVRVQELPNRDEGTVFPRTYKQKRADGSPDRPTFVRSLHQLARTL